MRKLNSNKTSLFYSLFFCIGMPFLSTQCSQHKSAEEPSVAAAVPFSGGNNSTEAEAASNKDAAPPNQNSPVPTTSVTKNDSVSKRKLLKEGRLKWETRNMNKTHASILAQAKKYEAYIADDNQSRNEYEISNTMEIRIPSDKFDDFVNTIEKDITKFDEKNIKVLDVTEEYIDVSSRIKTKKELEQHYYDLLKQTKNISEVLQVEQQLNIVREEIESAEGRLKYLADRISMSTLYLHFYETTSAPVGFFGELAKSFIGGWKSLLYFVLGIIQVWPFILIISLVVYYLYKRAKNRSTSKKV